MAKEVYLAAVGLTKVDLTGHIFSTVFDLFADAYRKALADSSVRSFDGLQVGIMDSEEFENAPTSRPRSLTAWAHRHPRGSHRDGLLTGAAAFHEAHYKIASGSSRTCSCSGERMKMVTTEVATAHVEDRRPRGAPLRLHDAGADRAGDPGVVPRTPA
jgi:hypothetical protein